jgi:hypothetical protein
LIALVALMLLGACAAPVVSQHVELPQPRLSPDAMGTVVSLEQRLTIERAPDGRPMTTRSLDTLLEIDSQSVRMAAFALGQRVLTLNWDGINLVSERNPLLPAEVDAAYVLRDVQWMYAPLQALRTVLPPGWLLEEVGGERVLRHDGVPVLLIQYDSALRWNGRSRLENRLEGYMLTIESANQPPGS